METQPLTIRTRAALDARRAIIETVAEFALGPRDLRRPGVDGGVDACDAVVDAALDVTIDDADEIDLDTMIEWSIETARRIRVGPTHGPPAPTPATPQC